MVAYPAYRFLYIRGAGSFRPRFQLRQCWSLGWVVGAGVLALGLYLWRLLAVRCAPVLPAEESRGAEEERCHADSAYSINSSLISWLPFQLRCLVEN